MTAEHNGTTPQPTNPHGGRPGGGIALPPYFKPTTAWPAGFTIDLAPMLPQPAAEEK